ncbi:MAG TPA: AAA family ATPase [Chthoniobacteraceae bacterium]|nr:AAA family ATPase [Chthoniobacteraceae bacterium]
MNPQPIENFPSPTNSFTPLPSALGGEADSLAELIQPFPAPPPPPAVGPLVSARDFLAAFGLRENPFADCVHPGFFYRTESHQAAFSNMMLAVEFDAALGLLTGPSGTGKTLVSQLLLEHLNQPQYKTILVLVTPGMSKTGLLREILAEMNVALPVGITPLHDLVKLLSNEIIDLYRRGLRLVILLDECHLLTSDCLHVVRTISNIEIPQRKLVTCLLFAEARLLQRLQHPSYESLRNRIYVRSALAPLTQVDVGQYVKYRLIVAGRMTELFTLSAIGALHFHSGGICRSLNKLCLLSLVEAAVHHRPVIDESIVADCAARM